MQMNHSTLSNTNKNSNEGHPLVNDYGRKPQTGRMEMRKTEKALPSVQSPYVDNNFECFDVNVVSACSSFIDSDASNAHAAPSVNILIDK